MGHFTDSQVQPDHFQLGGEGTGYIFVGKHSCLLGYSQGVGRICKTANIIAIIGS